MSYTECNLFKNEQLIFEAFFLKQINPLKKKKAISKFFHSYSPRIIKYMKYQIRVSDLIIMIRVVVIIIIIIFWFDITFSIIRY